MNGSVPCHCGRQRLSKYLCLLRLLLLSGLHLVQRLHHPRHCISRSPVENVRLDQHFRVCKERGVLNCSLSYFGHRLIRTRNLSLNFLHLLLHDLHLDLHLSQSSRRSRVALACLARAESGIASRVSLWEQGSSRGPAQARCRSSSEW